VAGSVVNLGSKNLDVGGNNTSTTFAGTITNTGSLTKSGTGTLTLSGASANTYNGTTTVSAGTLVVSKASLTATIQSNSVAVVFPIPPTNGAYAVLPGAVDAASLATASVTGLASGQTATVANSPNLVVQVADAPAGPTFDSAFSGKAMTDVAPNGLSYLVNYAFGGTKTNEAKLPSQDFSDPTKLTLVAYVRTNNTGGTLQVKGEKGNSLTSFDTNNLINGVPAGDNIGAPVGTQKQIFSVTNSGDRLFLRLRVTK